MGYLLQHLGLSNVIFAAWNILSLYTSVS
uniref:Uncharacterized protein n=1 Tax=Rhizophora mucronata TaxID=61149 RepID=A0A2P2ITJ6_RHIMU